MLTPFGEEMKRICKKYGVSSSKLAKQLGMSRAYLSTIEHGKRRIPQDVECAISSHLGLSEEDRKSLRLAIESSTDTLVVDMSAFNEKQKHIVWHIIENKLTIEQTEEILKMIEEEKK